MTNPKKEGMIIVISGPSASGKGTVNAEILKDDRFALSISATTREPRGTEQRGVDYHYITEEAFQKMIDGNELLEYAKYTSGWYGTPRAFVEENRAAGRHVILEIEVEGAMKIREQFPDAVLIFLLAPSFAEQERRLRARMTETEEQIEKRLKKTLQEVPQIDKYDYVVVNETGRSLEAAADVLAIIRAELRKVSRNPGIPEMYFGDGIR